jgi:hypothetical protein
MLTCTKLTRLWTAGRFRALIREALAGRPEGRLELDQRRGGPIVAAALALLRLCELNQPGHRLAGVLRDRLIWTQGAAGDWSGDAAVTALVARALTTADGQRTTVGRTIAKGVRASTPADRAIDWLTSRGPADWGDDWAVAVVLLQLGREPAFREKVDLAEVLAMESRAGGAVEADAVTRLAWKHAKLRVGKVVDVGRRKPVFDRPPLFAGVGQAVTAPVAA